MMGAKVACKLQYPDMASAVESDVGQLKMLLGMFKRLDGSVDPTEVVEEVTDRLREELDYAREAKHMALYRHLLQATQNMSKYPTLCRNSVRIVC